MNRAATLTPPITHAELRQPVAGSPKLPMRDRFEPTFGIATSVYVGFAMLLALIAAIFVFTSQQAQLFSGVQEGIQERRSLVRVYTDLLDSETGQRGYLLTSDRSYLDPYEAGVAGIDADFKALEDVAKGADHDEMETLRGLADQKLAELRATIALQDSHKADEALALVNSGTGKGIMDQIRTRVEALSLHTQQRIDAQLDTARHEGDVLRLGALIAILTALAVGGASIRRLQRQVKEIAAGRDELREANLALSAEAQHRAELAERLRQSQKMEAIGQLTGGLAHDFNNMLAVIVSSVELARRHMAKADGDPYRFLDAAQKGAERAATLTHRLLAFSRQQPLSPRPIDPNRMVGGMAELLHRTLGETVQLETVLGAGLWRAQADPAQLENAILNLAVNARDAMPEGGKLTIETNNAYLDDEYAARHVGVPAGQYVLIAISDTGSGIAPQIVDKIFDPFFTTKPVGKGTGLGLSQVYGFVRQSGGHIKVYSEPGSGTTVKIYLPRHFGDEAHEAAPSLETRARGDGWRDNRRRGGRRRRPPTGCRYAHRVGLQGLRILQRRERFASSQHRGEVDVLFTDVVMPEMDGRQLAEQARTQRPELKVLFTTGYTQNAIVHGGVLDRGVDLIAKPYPVDKLARKIREILDRSA